MNNPKDKNASHLNKFRLISQFVEQSALISKNSSNLNQFISEVKRSRQVITFEPNFNVKYDSAYESSNNFNKVFRVNTEERPDQNQRKSFNSSGLKQSFAKSEIDQTTYESLMHEFMGSYLEERLSSQKNKNNHFNSGNQQNRSTEAPYFVAPLVQAIDESPINKDSQITFSGSKESRIINENQESRIIREEYFLLDQLKQSKKLQKSPLRQKTYYHQLQDQLDHNKYFLQESYKLRAPTSPQRLRQSAQKLRQNLDKKPTNFSKQKVKVQRINLIEEAQTKSILKSGIKKSDQKYNISKQVSTQKKNDHYEVKDLTFSKRNTRLQDSQHSKLSNSRNIHNSHSKSKYKQEPMTIYVTLQKQDPIVNTKLNSRSRNNSKSPNKSNNNSNSKSAKKIDISNYLKTHKTFNVNSSKWKQEKQSQKSFTSKAEQHQPYKKTFALAKNNDMSAQKSFVLDSSNKFIKIAKDRPQVTLPSDDKQKRSQSQTYKTLNSQKKYHYEHSYNMGNLDSMPQSSSLLNTYREMYSNNMKSSRVQQNSYLYPNEEQADIQKDRQMIRQIKKDLTKLIQKISSTSKKHTH